MINLEDMLLGHARRVSHVDRFAGVPRTRRESVAEHMYYAAQYSLLIGMHLKDRGLPINMGVLLSRALVHDLDEAVTGDIRRDIKYRSERVRLLWEEMAKEVIITMDATLKVNVSQLWAEAKDDSYEGMVLRFADLACVAAYAIEEILNGNQYFVQVLRENLTWWRRWTGATELPHELQLLHDTITSIIERYLQPHQSHERT